MRLSVVGWVPAIALFAGCAYVPGSLGRRDDVYAVRRVGCLDIAVRPIRDPVVAFTIGNCCHYPVAVDFNKVIVRAWDRDLVEHRPTADDPRDELYVAVIDGHDEVRTAIDFPVARTTPHFCVDVARLNVDEPAAHPVSMCFHSYDGWGLIFADDAPAEGTP